MCSQTFAKNDKMVREICIKCASWCKTGSKAEHNAACGPLRMKIMQEAYHPNGLPEYDKAVDFHRLLSEIILTI
jgi:hypothetical protein